MGVLESFMSFGQNDSMKSWNSFLRQAQGKVHSLINLESIGIKAIASKVRLSEGFR